MAKFNLQSLSNIKDNSPYGFESRWNKKSIKKAFDEAKKTNNFPNFYLSKVEIHPTSFCNLNCNYCYGSKLRPDKKSELDFVVFRNLLKDIQEKMREDPLIIFSGLYSEPLTHSKIRNMIRLIGDRGFMFAIYTNGELLNEELVREIVESAERTTKKIPSYISINISALLSISKEEKLIENIQMLVKENKNNRLQINTNIVVLKDKLDKIKKIISQLDNMGVDNIRISMPWNKIVNGSELRYKLSFDKYKKDVAILNELKNISSKVRIRFPENTNISKKCYGMALSLSIDSQGFVYPCPEKTAPLFRKNFSYGNISEKPLSKIWKSKKHKELWDKIKPRQNYCSCCPISAKFNSFCDGLDIF